MYLGFIKEVELTKFGKCMQNIKENNRSALSAKTWKAHKSSLHPLVLVFCYGYNKLPQV